MKNSKQNSSILSWKLLLVALFTLLYINPVTAQKIKTLRNIDWLEGKWMMAGKKGNIYEIWKLTDDNLMEGRSYKVFKKDTTFLETMKITLEDNTIYYTPTVKGQNNDEPVRFTMKDGNRRQLEFENQSHDFPKTITYQWKQNDHFDAILTGLIKGKKKTQLFIFKKIK